MIGASGAISAVLGAYAVLFGRNKVKVASRRLALALNALWLLAAWVGLNLLIGIIVARRLHPGDRAGDEDRGRRPYRRLHPRPRCSPSRC